MAPEAPPMEEELRTLIISTANLARNVAWGVRPQRSALPGVTLQLISDVTNRTYQGGDGSWMTRVQVDTWGENYLSARRVSRQIATLDCYKGIVGDVQFSGIFVVDGASSFEDTPEGVMHRSRIDLMVHYKVKE